MMKNLATSICLLLTFVSPAFAQVPYTSDFYPLVVGSKWTYRVIDLKAPQTKADPKRKVVIEVEREEPYIHKESKDGKDTEKKYMGFILKATSGDKLTRDHVIVLEQGVHSIHVAGTPILPPKLFFKLGLKPGESWTTDSVGGNTILKGTSTVNQVVVDLPKLGKRDAFLISYSNDKKGDQRQEIDYWFVQGIGMVKQRVMTKNHEIVLELENYEKAK